MPRREAGIGKTAMLEHVVDHIPGWRVVRAVGIEAEKELAFSASIPTSMTGTSPRSVIASAGLRLARTEPLEGLREHLAPETG